MSRFAKKFRLLILQFRMLSFKILDNLNKRTFSDNIAFLALIATIGSLYLTRMEIRESQLQFAIQREDDKSKDSIERIRVDRQFSELKRKNDMDISYYQGQLKISNRTDSLNRIAHIHQKVHDSIQDQYTIKNQKISVLPFVTVEVVTGHDTPPVGIYLLNNGLGPGIVTKVEIIYDGVIFTENSRFGKYFMVKNRDIFKEIAFSFTDLFNNWVIYQNKKSHIFTTPSENVLDMDRFWEIIDQDVYIRYSYKSFHNQEFKTGFGFGKNLPTKSQHFRID